MKVEDLIKILNELPDDADVLVDAGGWVHTVDAVNLHFDPGADDPDVRLSVDWDVSLLRDSVDDQPAE